MALYLRFKSHLYWNGKSYKGKNDSDITPELKALLHYFEDTTDEAAGRI